MNRHQQDKSYPGVWWLKWWFIVKDGAGQELELLRVRAVTAGVQQVRALGLQGGEETNASEHRQKRCPPSPGEAAGCNCSSEICPASS